MNSAMQEIIPNHKYMYVYSEKKNQFNGRHHYHYYQFFNPLSPTGDLDRSSPYVISMISSRQVIRIKKNINWGIIG